MLWLLSGVLTVCLSLLASSGSYGERDGVGWGCDCERRALPERCQRAASQIHQRIGPRATNHHVTSCGAKKKKQPFIWTQLKTQTVPERERERARAVKEKRKKEQNNIFFTYFNSFELVFSPAWLHRPSIRNDEHMICKKKQPSPPDRFITLVSWIWWMINVSALMERRWRAWLIYLGWLSVRRWRV